MSDATELELALAQAGNGSAPPWLHVLAAEVQRLRVERDDAERRNRSAQAHAAEWRERKEDVERQLQAALTIGRLAALAEQYLTEVVDPATVPASRVALVKDFAAWLLPRLAAPSSPAVR